MKKISSIILMLLVVLSSIAFATQQTTFGVQGTAKYSNGTIIPSGDVTVKVTENDCASPIFEEEYPNNISSGKYNIQVGQLDTISLDYNKPYKLCLYIEGELQTLSPSDWFRGGQGQINANDISTTEDFNFNGILINITSCDSLDTDSNGLIICGVDASGDGGEMDYTNIAMTNESNTFTENQIINISNTSGELTIEGSPSEGWTGARIRLISPANYRSRIWLSNNDNFASETNPLSWEIISDKSNQKFRIRNENYTEMLGITQDGQITFGGDLDVSGNLAVISGGFGIPKDQTMTFYQGDGGSGFGINVGFDSGTNKLRFTNDTSDVLITINDDNGDLELLQGSFIGDGSQLTGIQADVGVNIAMTNETNTFTENQTMQEDLIVIGSIYSESPVKIPDGIDFGGGTMTYRNDTTRFYLSDELYVYADVITTGLYGQILYLASDNLSPQGTLRYDKDSEPYRFELLAGDGNDTLYTSGNIEADGDIKALGTITSTFDGTAIKIQDESQYAFEDTGNVNIGFSSSNGNRMSFVGADFYRFDNDGMINGELNITSLQNCNTIDTDGNGMLSCGTDEVSYDMNYGDYQFAETNKSNTFTQSQRMDNPLFFSDNGNNQTAILHNQGGSLVFSNSSGSWNFAILDNGIIKIQGLGVCDKLITYNQGGSYLVGCGTDETGMQYGDYQFAEMNETNNFTQDQIIDIGNKIYFDYINDKYLYLDASGSNVTWKLTLNNMHLKVLGLVYANSFHAGSGTGEYVLGGNTGLMHESSLSTFSYDGSGNWEITDGAVGWHHLKVGNIITYGDITISADNLLKLPANTTAITCDGTNINSIMGSSDNKPYWCDGTSWSVMV